MGDPAAARVTPYEQLGGEAKLRELVERFYDLMDLEPEYAEIRKLHPTALAHSREKLFMFLSGWLGGPGLYVERHKHPMLRARHLPFAIGRAEGRSRGPACGDATLQARVARGIRRAVARSRVAPPPSGRRHCSAVRGPPSATRGWRA